MNEKDRRESGFVQREIGIEERWTGIDRVILMKERPFTIMSSDLIFFPAEIFFKNVGHVFG